MVVEEREAEKKNEFFSSLSLSFPRGCVRRGVGGRIVLLLLLLLFCFRFHSASNRSSPFFQELRLFDTDSATDDAASLTLLMVSSLSESATFWTVGARICAAGAKAPSTDSNPADEGDAASSATEEEKSDEEEEASIFLEPLEAANELTTEAAASFTLSTVDAGTFSATFAAAGARAPTTAWTPEEEGADAEEEFPFIMSRKALVSRLACSSFRPVLEAQSTRFHSTFQRPSPFIAKSMSPYLHSGQRLLTAAKNVPTGLPPAPTPVPRPSMQMPQLLPPS